MGSYEEINYNLRPAKCIERKMLCEAFGRLSVFGKIESYGYIGFGSNYFTDFSLFHKALNICNMTSIEKDTSNKKRFEFNKPFSCIKIEFGNSTEVLPRLNLDSKKIVWLDYDGKLTKDILLDLNYIFSKAVSGSVIIVSINVTPETLSDEISESRLEKIKVEIGSNKVPNDTSEKSFPGWGTARVCRKIILNEISQILNTRNAEYKKENKLCYRQLFNFHYSDNAKMLTTGGIIYDEGHESHLTRCSFNDLSFVRENEEEYIIKVPNLTFKEIRHLDELRWTPKPEQFQCPNKL